MESISINPFAAGNLVTGDSFIGRSKELSMLWQRAVIKRAFTQIVGLPRMGKSSLVKQCFEIREKELRQDYKTIYIYKEGAESTLLKFWQLRARQINREVQKLVDVASDQKKALKDKYESLDSSDYDSFHQDLCEYLSEIKEMTGYWILFALDEFDDYPASCKSDFIKIDELCSSFCTIITISHRPIKLLEEDIYGKAYLYSRHLKPFYVGVYSEEDWNLYWQKYRSLIPLNDTQFEEYKQTVFDYVGYLPFLIDHFNEEAFPWGMDNFENNRQEMEFQLRVSIRENILRDQIKYISDYKLEDAAKSLLFGEIIDGIEDDEQLLINYNFLKLIPSSQKDSLFPTPLGPRLANGSLAYACFSRFATYLTYPLYTDFPTLNDTERKLKEIIKSFLKETYGSNCFDVIVDDYSAGNVTSAVYEERWESLMLAQLSGNTTQWEADLFNAKETRRNTLQFETNTNAGDRLLVDFADLGKLWYLFFDKKWNWFSHVFGTNKNQWKRDFDLIRRSRNYKCHPQWRQTPRLEECIDACKRTCKKIDDYLIQHQ